MLKEERQRVIVNEVRIHSRVSLSDLSDKLDVSIDTARRDVKELDALGTLKKVHGGAVSLGFALHNYKEQNIYLHEKKSRIAEKAVSLIPNRSVILISGGTTNLEMARVLPSKLKITVFTPSLPIAMQLILHPNAEVIFIGGKLSKEAKITTGGKAIYDISQVKVDIGFIGTGYIDIQNGLTEFDWDVVQMKKAMIAASKKVIVPTISEKLNTSQCYKTCDLTEVDTLITELEPNHPKLKGFREFPIKLL